MIISQADIDDLSAILQLQRTAFLQEDRFHDGVEAVFMEKTIG